MTLTYKQKRLLNQGMRAQSHRGIREQLYMILRAQYDFLGRTNIIWGPLIAHQERVNKERRRAHWERHRVDRDHMTRFYENIMEDPMIKAAFNVIVEDQE